jgi:16S rRNA (guanine527-N7)-methyltransferase
MSTPQPDFSAQHHRALMIELAQALGLSLDSTSIDQLARYAELVVTWNKKLDLTAARGAQQQLEVLLADSLVLSSSDIVPAASRCVDVGSGAGAPALPLLLLRADLRATLVEPLRKRVAFLRTAIGTLSLAARVRVAEAKLDPERPVLTGSPFDLALSRATFDPAIWVPAALQLAPRVLALLAAKAAPAAPAGSQLLHTHEYRLPWSGAARTIAVYKRTPAD